ncbi:D-Ala-D-Ala dipeptidase [Fervidicella metallireducens AeB]|uniref:D-alanyl-D-alanine dipeptidase n=1 Tax=Fervidicella metallireducens AeB TaxID=1403537 RepID=A0A017RWM9_9CLOT|nr:D-Ala-D-Ala dipeptidase [Fervidicella metallireducens AeB]
MGRHEKVIINFCIATILICLSIMSLYVYFVFENEKNTNTFRLIETDEFLGKILILVDETYKKSVSVFSKIDNKGKRVEKQTSANNYISEPKKKKIDEVRDIKGLVNLEEIDSNFVIELRYATEENFTRQKIYPKAVCMLRRETAKKLINANNEFNKMGYRIKIWDAYRPYYVQKILYDIAVDKEFLANPVSGSKHNRGAAVDITLVDEDERELSMPTGFDEFTNRASQNYIGMSEIQKKNLECLRSVMEKNGFISVKNEWWHFTDSDWEKYPLLNIRLEDIK